MKLKYFFMAFISAFAVLFTTSCADDETLGGLGLISVDKTYVTIPETGGTTTVVLNAVDSWSIVESSIPQGVTISPLSGNAGETTLTFKSPAVKKDIKGEIEILCGGKTQYLKYFQAGDPALKPKYDEFVAGDYWMMFKVEDKWLASKPAGATIDDAGSYGYVSCVDASGSDEKGYTSTAANVFTFEAVDGGFVIKDTEGGYIYQDAAGKYNNFYRTSKKENAMVWTVEQISDTEFEITSTQGKYIQYSTGYATWGAYTSKQDGSVLPFLVPAKDPAPEVLVVENPTANVEKAGGKVMIPAMINATSVSVDFAESWLHYYGNNAEGFNFACDANDGGARSAKVNVTAVLKTAAGEYTGEAVLEIVQEGSIVDCSIADFNAAPKGETQYRISGVISEINNASKGRFYIKDYSDQTYVYNMAGFEETGLKVGDIVTLIGKKDEYNGTMELVSATLESSQVVEKISLADFKALEDDATKSKYYMIEGVVAQPTEENTKFDLETYGNFALTDGTTELYIYGCTPGYNGPSKLFGTLGVKEGDKLCMLAYKTSYKGLVEGVGFYFSHEAAAPAKRRK